uniref:PoNe immunity protein domain-containing protein n=1 Tax=Cupriavidus taiwanensis TaxID=164546 RepID=UPI001F11CABB|nr:PoNe immunity protein domain-containing protein [Cupriavidus taiwanensis]
MVRHSQTGCPGRTSGYYGYWSFEAAAAVLLLGIEDDSSLHPYLYYPNELVSWAKTQ